MTSKEKSSKNVSLRKGISQDCTYPECKHDLHTKKKTVINIPNTSKAKDHNIQNKKVSHTIIPKICFMAIPLMSIKIYYHNPVRVSTMSITKTVNYICWKNDFLLQNKLPGDAKTKKSKVNTKRNISESTKPASSFSSTMMKTSSYVYCPSTFHCKFSCQNRPTNLLPEWAKNLLLHKKVWEESNWWNLQQEKVQYTKKFKYIY